MALLWPHVLKENVEIGFAYQTFKWTNNAKSQAAVICVIVGLRNKSAKSKYIFHNTLKIQSNNISPYLIDGQTIYVFGKNNPLSNLPELCFG